MTVPVKPQINMEELDKLDIRVGTIVDVSDVAGSDKLLMLTVDLGETTTRTVLVGMKKERKDPRAHEI